MTPEQMRSTLTAEGVPVHNHESLINYVLQGIKPGSFLAALLSNDLATAYSRADYINVQHVGDIVRWLFIYAPPDCWGCPEAFAYHCERGWVLECKR